MSLEKILRLSGHAVPPAAGDDLRELVRAVHLSLSEATASADPVEAAQLVLAAGSAAEGLYSMLYGEGMTDWVEATAGPADGGIMLASGSSAKEPYGSDAGYADPGYQADGKKRYPTDTEEHTRAAWSYINMAKNAKAYTSAQLSKIKGKIKAAMGRHGIGANVAASSAIGGLADGTLLLAAAPAGSVPMHHPPMKGRHAHPHTVVMVHDHEHDHMGDSSHGSSPECRNSSAGKAWPNPHHMGGYED
jgi:uncharacterized protein DUF6582